MFNMWQEVLPDKQVFQVFAEVSYLVKKCHCNPVAMGGYMQVLSVG